MRTASVMHLEVFVGAIAKELRAARPEVGESGHVLLRRGGRFSVEMDRGHNFAPCMFCRIIEPSAKARTVRRCCEDQLPLWTYGARGYDKVCNHYLDWFVILIERRRSQLDQSLLGSRF
jgi:hypothetical protein